ncbi:sensor histidine kinase [Clostridium nigeriense]|uniref:sensor histidine kinase n=1 Tax=Clostridium nigeriense TaxID=1805470 RepID=UPI003D3256D2
MIWILLILLIPSVYFSARFFLISKEIKEATGDLKEISENIELNRRLTSLDGDKNFEKFLIVVNKYLEESQREKIKYIRREKEIRKEIENISHDLRTPLTSILGYLEFLENEDIREKEKAEYLAIIKRRSIGLYNLVQIFYDLSRLEANEYKFNIEKVDINKAVREYILLFYNDFEKKNIEVEVALLNEEAFVEVDKNALERIFTNLLENVIKYANYKFKVSLEKNNNNVKIILVNDANTLDENDVEHIFDRFYMKDSSRSNSSSGLGLTVAKLLVEQMNGEIKVDINKDILCFSITFILNNDEVNY